MAHVGQAWGARLRRWFWPAAWVVVTLVAAMWAGTIGLLEGAPPSSAGTTRSTVGVADPRWAAFIESARRHARALLAERNLPGLSVAVAVRGEVVWSEAFGFADVATARPAAPATRFRVCSVSKPFTAAAMARLVESGRLDADAPIRRYVPSFPDRSGSPITARLLASHRAGVRAYRDDMEPFTAPAFATVSESLGPFREDPLVFEPGAGHLYSNYGFVLLSAAIEGAAGADFLSVMRREVFEPLGMSSTGEDRGEGATPERATMYDHVPPYSMDGRVVVSPPQDLSGRWASGGFLSTAEDAARFGAAHTFGSRSGFLSDRTLREMFTPRSGLPPLAGYGTGWISARDLHARRVCFHFGAGSGGTSFLGVYPGSGVSVAVLANLGHANFPVGRLMGIAGPFLPDPARWVITGLAATSAAGAIRFFVRQARARRRAPADARPSAG